jgi:hypothetical protein
LGKSYLLRFLAWGDDSPMPQLSSVSRRADVQAKAER